MRTQVILRLIFTLITVIVICAQPPSAFGDEEFALEVRIVADTVKDKPIVQLAQEQSNLVRRKDKLVAKWVETHPETWGPEINKELQRPVVRVLGETGALQVLVLIIHSDVVDSVKSRGLTYVQPHVDGRELGAAVPVWQIKLTEKGRQELWNLTRKNEGRAAALIVNNKLRAALPIHGPVRNLVVPATRSEAPKDYDWEKISERMDAVRERRQLIIWAVAGAILLFGLLALAIGLGWVVRHYSGGKASE